VVEAGEEVRGRVRFARSASQVDGVDLIEHATSEVRVRQVHNVSPY